MEDNQYTLPMVINFTPLTLLLPHTLLITCHSLLGLDESMHL